MYTTDGESIPLGAIVRLAKLMLKGSSILTVLKI